MDQLLSPPILGFLLGFIAALVKSDLRIPEVTYQTISIYLLFAIGLKGGHQLHDISMIKLSTDIVTVIITGLLTATVAFYLSKLLLKNNKKQRGAIAAHYGSVSAVTFIAATEFLKGRGLFYEGHFPALVAVMEVPGIILALVLAQNKISEIRWDSILNILKGKSVLMLLGGFAIGMLSSSPSIESLRPFFVDPFKGILVFFLLELGVMAGSRWRNFRDLQVGILVLAIAIPIITGFIGLFAAYFAGLSVGGIMLLATLAASSSYIAAPAAVKDSLPEASLPDCVTMSLGVTFPINLILGLSFWLKMAMFLKGQ